MKNNRTTNRPHMIFQGRPTWDVPGVGHWEYRISDQSETWDRQMLDLVYITPPAAPALFELLNEVDQERLRIAIRRSKEETLPFDLFVSLRSNSIQRRLRIIGGVDSRSLEVVRAVCLRDDVGQSSPHSSGHSNSHLESSSLKASAVPGQAIAYRLIIDDSGKIVAADHGMSQLFGNLSADIGGRSVSDFVPADQVEVAKLLPPLRAREFESAELMIRRTQDNTVTAHITAYPLRRDRALWHIVESCHQVDFNEASSILKAANNPSANEFHLLVRLGPRGEIKDVNERFEKETGYSIEDVRGQRWLDLVNGGEAPSSRDSAVGLESSRPTIPFDLVRSPVHGQATRQDGVRQYQWTIEAIPNRMGGPTEWIAIGSDVTHIRQLEEETQLEREISSGLNACVFVVRISDREILYVNPRVTQMLGFSKQDLIGQPINIALDDESDNTNERLGEIFAEASRAGSWCGYLMLSSSAGNRDWLRAIVTIHNHKKHGRLGFIRVEPNTQEEDASSTHENWDHFQKHFEHNPLPNYLWERIEQEHDFRLVDFNRAAERYSDGFIRSAVGIRLSEFAVQAPEVLDDFWKVVETGESLRREMPCLFDQGKTNPRFVDVSYVIVPPNCIMVQTDDITSRKQGELALRRVKARLQRLLEHAPVLVCGIDQDLNIDFWNNECERVTGFTQQEIVERPRGWELLFPESKLQEKIVETWNDGIGNYRNWRLPMICKNGDTRIISWSSIAAKVPIEGWVDWAVGVDVTDQVQAEDHLRESEERLRFAMSGSKQGLWDLDIPSGIAQVSKDYWRMLGFDTFKQSESIQGWLDSIHPEDLDQAAKTFHAFMAGEIVDYSNEYRLRTSGGGWRWILSAGEIVERDPFGRPLRMVGTHVDVSELKEVQAQLRETTERYRILFEQCPDAILIIDMESRRILECNSAFEEILGYSRSQTLALRVQDLEANETLEEVKAHFERLAAQGSDRFETRLWRSDGTIIDVLASIRVIELSGEKRLHAVLRDITAQKLAERHLRQILESCFGFIGLYDLDGKLIEVNQAPLDAAGLTRAEVIGYPIWDSSCWKYHPKSESDLRDAVRQAVEGKRVRFECSLRDRRGRPMIIDVVFGPVRNADDRVTHVVSFGVDITEAKRAGALLQKSEQFVRDVLDTLSDPLAVVDGDGYIVHANLAWKETVNEGHELIAEFEGGNYGMSCLRAAAEGSENAHRLATELQSLLVGDSAGFSFEYSVSSNEQIRWFVCRGKRIALQESYAAKLIHTDITAIKAAEMEREHLLNQLAHAGRVAVMGETTAGVAHELNQPLAALRLYAENCLACLEDGKLEEPEIRDHLFEVARLAGVSGDIIRRLLRFARKSPTKSAVINLVDLIHAVVRFIAHDLRLNQIAINLEIPDTPIQVFGDSVQLHQVLLNLLKNAIESYTESETERRQIDITIVAHANEYAEVRIRDYGRPIGPEEAKRLREPFFTTKPSGLGMGLKISESIIHAHGGELTWSAEDGQGKVFSITIPSHEGAANV